MQPHEENFVWRVHYDDGTVFDEYEWIEAPKLLADERTVDADPDPNDLAQGDISEGHWQDHGFAEVDMARVVAVELIPQREDLAHHLVKIDTSRGQRPIFFRRRYINLDPVTFEEQRNRMSATCLGWQNTVNGSNVASYTFYFDNGSSLVTDDHNAI